MKFGLLNSQCMLEMTDIYHIFLSALQHDIATTKKVISTSKLDAEYYLKPLFALANIEGIPQLLRLCLEMGPLPRRYALTDWLLSRRVTNNPSTEWLDVLFNFDFWQWRTDPEQLNRWKTWRHVLRMSPDCVRWWIEHGGHTSSARDLFFETDGWPGAPTFRILLDHFGIGWFADSGTLQLAVSRLDFETVKLLVEAGADVNERVTDWQTDIRENRAAPLPAMHEAVYAKSEEMIRYLAAHGAKVARRNTYHDHNPRRLELKPYMDLVIELGAVE